MASDFATKGVGSARRGHTGDVRHLDRPHHLGFLDAVEEGIAGVAAGAAADRIVVDDLNINTELRHKCTNLFFNFFICIYIYIFLIMILQNNNFPPHTFYIWMGFHK